MLTLGTGVGGGLVIDDRLYRGWAELGHIGRGRRRPAVPGELPRPRASRGACLGARGRPGGRDALRAGRRCAGARRAGAGGRRAARSAALAEIGRLLGAAIGSLVNIFDPDVVIVGGGFGAAAGDLVLEPARDRGAGRGDPAGRRDAADRRGRARRRSRPDRGGARRVRGARRSAVTRAARRLRDADRQPRRRHAARARGARGARTRSSARTRATRGSSSSATGSRRACSPTTSTTRRRASPSSCRGSSPASGWRSSRTPACRASTIPGARLVAAALAAGVAGDGPARAVGRRDRARRERPRRRAVPVRRLPARGARASGRRSGSELAAWPHPTVAFESPKRLPATLASLAACRARPARRRLPRADEGSTRRSSASTAAVVAERFREPPKGEVTLVIGPSHARRPTRRQRSRPWSSSSRPERQRSVAAATSSPGSPVSPATRSTAIRSSSRLVQLGLRHASSA